MSKFELNYLQSAVHRRSGCRSFLSELDASCAASPRRLASTRKECHRKRMEALSYPLFSSPRSKYYESTRARSSWRAAWSSAAPLFHRTGPRELDTCRRCRSLWRFRWCRWVPLFIDGFLQFSGTLRFPCMLRIIFWGLPGPPSLVALKYNWSI